MAHDDDFAAIWGPRAIALLRIVAGLLFMCHGLQKLIGFPAPPPTGLPAVLSLLWFAAVIETCGGALLVLGLLARPAAFILSGEMAVAYWMAHAPHGFFPIVNRGEAAVLYCFIFLTLFVTGPGAWALASVLWRRSPVTRTA